MRSGPARRCASYWTWSSRSRTTVLESIDDQWRMPVTAGNFVSSCCEAGELSSELVSASDVAAVAAGFEVASVPVGADITVASFPAELSPGFTVDFSVRALL